MSDYTSDTVMNDLKVDSTTSLPVHNNEESMIMVVNKAAENVKYQYSMSGQRNKRIKAHY